MIAINQLVDIKAGLLRSPEEKNPERLISSGYSTRLHLGMLFLLAIYFYPLFFFTSLCTPFDFFAQK